MEEEKLRLENKKSGCTQTIYIFFFADTSFQNQYLLLQIEYFWYSWVLQITFIFYLELQFTNVMQNLILESWSENCLPPPPAPVQREVGGSKKYAFPPEFTIAGS